jgi:hypothetical protein
MATAARPVMVALRDLDASSHTLLRKAATLARRVKPRGFKSAVVRRAPPI